MSNLPFQNDAALEALQASLADMQLPTNAKRRDELLYQSGVAAGRAQSQRWRRIVGAAAVVLVLAAGALSCFAGRATNETTAAQPLIADDSPAVMIEQPDDKSTTMSHKILCVTTPVEQLNQHFNANEAVIEFEATPLQPVLSTRSRL